MLAIYPILVLNRFCKLEIVGISTMRPMRKGTKAHSGLSSGSNKHKPFSQRPRLLRSHQNLAPVWAFSISTCRDCGDTKLESADADKRQGKANNRAIFPRSGRLTDYTRWFVTWVMRLQANYRIDQPVLRNVVLIGRLGL